MKINFEIANVSLLDGDVPRSHPCSTYTSQLIHFANACCNVSGKCLNANLLKPGYQFHNIRKAFFKFYQRHSEMIVRFNFD